MTEVVAPAQRGLDRDGALHAASIAAALFLLSWLRHRNHWTGFDLAIFDQAAWQLAHGDTHISIVERHVLADHFSPVMYLFAPLYRLAATPAWLLGAQAVALGATVLPMRAIARRVGQPPVRASLLVAGSAPLLAAGLFEFHPSTLAVPFIALAIAAALADRRGVALAAAGGVAVCRADLAPVIVAVAILATVRIRWYLVGVAVVAAMAAAVLPTQFGDATGWDTYFGHLGTGPVDVALHPWRPIFHLLSPSTLAVAVVWVAAAGVALLRRPRWALAVLVAGLPILLSQWKGTHLPWYHYGAPVVPFAIGGTLAGLSGLPTDGPLRARRVMAAAVFGPLATLLVVSPLSPGAPKSNRVWTFAFSEVDRDVDSAVALVRPGESVSAELRALPQLSHREHAYLYPVPFADAPDFFPPGSQPDLEKYGDDAVDVVIAPTGYEDFALEHGFEIVDEVDGYVVLRRPEDDGSP